MGPRSDSLATTRGARGEGTRADTIYRRVILAASFRSSIESRDDVDAVIAESFIARRRARASSTPRIRVVSLARHHRADRCHHRRRRARHRRTRDCFVFPWENLSNTSASTRSRARVGRRRAIGDFISSIILRRGDSPSPRKVVRASTRRSRVGPGRTRRRSSSVASPRCLRALH